MLEADRRGLCDPGNLEVFLLWWQLGGVQHPPTLTEILTWSATFAKDVQYLLVELGKARDRQERRTRGSVN